MNADKLRRHYKKEVSGFSDWDQKIHAEDYLLFPENMGKHLSIDEVSLSKGELYTYLTNKAGKGKKGTLVASIKGTKAFDIARVLNKLSLKSRIKVKEVTLDMARNMESGVKQCFPTAKLVTDRFHVVKLILESMQRLRMDLRWKALDAETKAIKRAKELGYKYTSKVLSNGDSPKQLLARSKYILAKKLEKWTENQQERAAVLFNVYPELRKAYEHTMYFRSIYEMQTPQRAREAFIKWYTDTYKKKYTHFYIAANSIKYHLKNILHFFINRNTNANAESFNSKIKLFRANLRGVTDIPFFLFRLANLFA